jgi:hypothetical protein
MKGVAQVPPRQRADLGILIKRISQPDGADALDEPLLECTPRRPR